jgi:predicted DNA-binding transcriptional regulator YafY
VERVRERIPATIAELTPDGAGACMLRMRADSLRWTAEVLASLGCAFAIVSPEELRAEVRAVATLLMDCAG